MDFGLLFRIVVGTRSCFDIEGAHSHKIYSLLPPPPPPPPASLSDAEISVAPATKSPPAAGHAEVYPPVALQPPRRVGGQAALQLADSPWWDIPLQSQPGGASPRCQPTQRTTQGMHRAMSPLCQSAMFYYSDKKWLNVGDVFVEITLQHFTQALGCFIQIFEKQNVTARWHKQTTRLHFITWWNISFFTSLEMGLIMLSCSDVKTLDIYSQLSII